jgi:hypothetical protein
MLSRDELAALNRGADVDLGDASPPGSNRELTEISQDGNSRWKIDGLL